MLLSHLPNPYCRMLTTDNGPFLGGANKTRGGSHSGIECLFVYVGIIMPTLT